MRQHYRFEMRHDDNAGGGRGEGRGRSAHMGRGRERGEQDARHERGHGRDFERDACSEREEGHHRRKRFFGHGELRILVLDILAQEPSHGYELIKSIETMTEGHYIPSPGVIYPTLDFLEANKLISLEDEENGRKKITITELGTQWLAAHHEELAQIKERMAARAVGRKLRANPEMKRALDNIKAVLDLKVNQQGVEPATLKNIIGIIDKAAYEISQLD